MKLPKQWINDYKSVNLNIFDNSNSDKSSNNDDDNNETPQTKINELINNNILNSKSKKELLFKCNKCNKQFKSYTGLCYHNNIHLKKYECNVCKK